MPAIFWRTRFARSGFSDKPSTQRARRRRWGAGLYLLTCRSTVYSALQSMGRCHSGPSLASVRPAGSPRAADLLSTPPIPHRPLVRCATLADTAMRARVRGAPPTARERTHQPPHILQRELCTDTRPHGSRREAAYEARTQKAVGKIRGSTIFRWG